MLGDKQEKWERNWMLVRYQIDHELRTHTERGRAGGFIGGLGELASG